ncbi:MAG TPA: DUF2784 domain-containing protein [Acidobacteriaceae bacterium]|jgi:hypothetical protein|nr:DUF2784 domain-containing protein [Acidobacteriaceae bacterium]
MGFLAASTSLIHLAFILLVIFGALWTRRRPFWTTVHLLALVWGIIVEVAPVPCPLTQLQMYFEQRAGVPVIQGSYLLHCINALIYPNVPYWVIAVCGSAVCGVNLAIYAWRGWVWRRRRREL